jgi:hypothetical protein
MKKPTPVLLEFDPALRFEHEKKALRDNLSVAVRTGRNLWTASDETTSLERLTEVRKGRFAAHRRFVLHDYLDLPGAAEDEVDVEGMGYEDGYLWFVGSHSLARKKPKSKADERENIERLATVSAGANRFLLARIPCVPEGEDGDHALARHAQLPSATKRKRAVELVAARLDGDEASNALTDEIEDDEHLAPFLGIPGKDNGFDVEGLAVAGDRLFVGLRGPVLRGWAVILSVGVEAKKKDPSRLALVEREVGATSKGKKVHRCYAKHFVNLAGMGIRELRAVGKDLLILAGPTMQLDATIAVWRWKGGAAADRDCYVPEHAIERLFDVPHGTGALSGKNKAEGMTLWPAKGAGRSGKPKELLVVYDGPDAKRCRGEAGVIADLFPIPGAVQREAARKHPRTKRRRTAAPASEDDDASYGESLTGRLMRRLGV